MAKATKESRRLYCFSNDEVIKERIEEIRGQVQFATLEPKYAWIIHKAIVAKTFNKEYVKKGFSLRKKSNSKALEQKPSLKIGTLSWLFGGNDKSIKEVVDNLILWGIIKHHMNYMVGKSATRYKLTSKWESEPVTMRRYFGRKGSLIYKLNHQWQERLKIPIVAATQTIYNQHVRLSEEGIRFIQQKYPDPRINNIAEALRGGYFEDNKEDLQNSLVGFPVASQDVVLMSFFIRDLYCNPPGKGKRLYHSITNLKREYRRFLLLAGEPIKEVDISNSQPTFAAAFLIRMHRNLFPDHPQPDDLLLMMELCRLGQFYERIAQQAGINLNSENRSKFKEDFFEQVFYARVTESQRRIKTAFRILFPTVYTMISGIKKENHKTFPLMMQDLEADLMVYTVYQQLLEEGYIVLVLHDAILCATEKGVRRAKELTRQAFLEWFGQEISFKGEV